MKNKTVETLRRIAEMSARDSKIAKLTEALNALEKEHRHQGECWQTGEEDGTVGEDGHAAYHYKWADFCKDALKGNLK